jgi:hypothetical protein
MHFLLGQIDEQDSRWTRLILRPISKKRKIFGFVPKDFAPSTHGHKLSKNGELEQRVIHSEERLAILSLFPDAATVSH